MLDALSLQSIVVEMRSGAARWVWESPHTSKYFYEEPISIFRLEKNSIEHQDPFPPSALDLSDTWVSKFLLSILKEEERIAR